MRTVILIVLLAFVCSSAVADDANKSAHPKETATHTEDDFKYCSIAGFAYGQENQLIRSLAMKLYIQKGLLQNPICNAMYKNGYEIEQRIANTGKVESETLVLQQFLEFKKKIEDSILRNAGF